MKAGRISDRLRKRPEFLAAAKGRRVGQSAFVLQARRRPAKADGQSPDVARFGFTVTKKIGKSVTRNRIRRRLREAVRQIAGEHSLPGTDYVLVARQDALTLPFDRLIGELAAGMDRINRMLAGAGRGGAGQPGNNEAGRPKARTADFGDAE